MKDLILAGRALALDFASTVFFLALYALTDNIKISVIAGIVVALGQLGWKLVRREKPDALQWISLVLVIASGSASLAVHDPIFVMLKPSAIYALVGCAMLQRGWMGRYMPSVVMQLMPDLVVTFGYVWAGLMFFSALLNLDLAFGLGVMTWGAVMSVWAIASKAVLFFAQYGIMRWIGRNRRRARLGVATASAATSA